MASVPISSSFCKLLYTSARRVPTVATLNRNNITNRRLCISGLSSLKPDSCFSLSCPDQQRSLLVNATPSNESAKNDEEQTRHRTLEEIPNRLRHLLVTRGYKQKPEVVIGKQGLKTGTMLSVLNHMNRRDVVRVKLSKACKVTTEEIAQDLLERSNGIILSQSGNKIILYRGQLSIATTLKWKNIQKNNSPKVS